MSFTKEQIDQYTKERGGYWGRHSPHVKMSFTEDHIEQNTKILDSYTNEGALCQASLRPQGAAGGLRGEALPPPQCKNCKSYLSFETKERGYFICEFCRALNGHVLGYYDLREYDRLYYRRKSIYQRRYHYENKVKDISKRLGLNEEEEHRLLKKLKKIDPETITKINEHFGRKRMISVSSLIKKKLQKMGCEKYQQIGLRISRKTFDSYEKWWEFYKALKQHPCEKTNKQPQSKDQVFHTL